MPDKTHASDRHRAPRLDPRAPLVIDTRDLGRRPGSMRELSWSIKAPADLGVEMIGVPAGAAIELEVMLESVVEGVLVSGTARVPLAGECARCLARVTDEADVRFQELYAYPDSATSETTEEGEALKMSGDLLDLEPVLRDAVVLGLPMTPLCEPECPGLCPVCGERLEAGGEPHDHEQIDPRWAALQRFAGGADEPADASDPVGDHVGDPPGRDGSTG